MNELPEGRRGKLLAVALLLTVAAALWAGAVVPLTEWFASRADRLEQQGRLARRMEQIAADLPELRRRANTVEAAAPVAVLEGASDSVAGAALQQRLQEIGSSVGAPLSSAEVLPGEPVGAYRRIGVRLSVSGTWPIVVQLIDAITASSPPLLVNDLSVESSRATMGPVEPLLSASMVVFGFRSGRAS